MASYLPGNVIIFQVQFFLSEAGRLERPLCFREFVPSQVSANRTGARACSEPTIEGPVELSLKQ